MELAASRVKAFSLPPMYSRRPSAGPFGLPKGVETVVVWISSGMVKTPLTTQTPFDHSRPTMAGEVVSSAKADYSRFHLLDRDLLGDFPGSLVCCNCLEEFGIGTAIRRPSHALVGAAAGPSP